MNTALLHECATRSHAGTITFPEVVMKLMSAGVESYHVDFYRGETTYYMPDGTSHIEPTPMPAAQIANDFSASAMEEAVRGAQSGILKYPEFLKAAMAAGCVGYLTAITGKRVIYSGRTGDAHTEFFPS
ncbi:MAG: DUF1398 family protein [Alphaproteobacteria bacterium]|nr:DUF1398 family protein [Alphaproteobacteria bacterium]MBU0859971.1 DUF1398 family protein [Alphaproteobacteria bacterium]